MKKGPIRRQVLRVKGCFAGSKAENLLEQGDMVLAINKEPVTCFRDIEDACQELDKCNNSDEMLKMIIFRQVCILSSFSYLVFFHFFNIVNINFNLLTHSGLDTLSSVRLRDLLVIDFIFCCPYGFFRAVKWSYWWEQM